MKTYTKLLTGFLIIGLSILSTTYSNAQCLTSPNGQWPSSTFTPTCTGTPQTITTIAFAGEYSVVSLTAGTYYRFASSITSDIITISDAAGVTAYTWAVGNVLFLPPATSTYRFYRHLTGCGSNTSSRTVTVTCSFSPQPCLTSPNGQWPSTTFTPTCTGTPQTIVTNAFEGEYSVVSLTAGVAYTFAINLATDIITISNSAGTFALATGTTPVTFTPATSGTYRFYRHLSTGCGSGATSRTITVQCGASSGPANDNCAGAITLIQNTSCISTAGTSVGASQTIAPSTCSGFTSTSALDVWYKFVATSSNPTIQVAGGTGFDAVLELRSGTCNGTFVQCVDATGSGSIETIVTSGLTIGATYLVRVYGWAGGTGTFNICVFGGAPPPPVNDNCPGTTLTVNAAPISGTVANSTQTIPAITCAGFTSTAANDVWYTFNAATSGTYAITVVGSTSFDAVIDLRSGSCNGTNIGCADATFSGGTETLIASLTPGAYLVRVYHWGSTIPSTPTFTISVILNSSPPSNDECTGVTPVTLISGVPQVFSGNSVGATTINDGGFTAYPTVWHAITLTSCSDVSVRYCGNSPATESGCCQAKGLLTMVYSSIVQECHR